MQTQHKLPIIALMIALMVCCLPFHLEGSHYIVYEDVLDQPVRN